MALPSDPRAVAQQLLDFIDASPTPWHAVASMERRLQETGFVRLDEGDRWQLAGGGRYYVVRGGSSLIAFIVGRAPLAEAGFRIVGAHTDSPGLRLKPRAALSGDGLMRLAVEVYGGPIVATFADRDFSLAGRVIVKCGAGVETRLVNFERPMARLPNLAIHMNREVNEKGLVLNKQTELPLIFAEIDNAADAEASLRQRLAERVQANGSEVLSWDLAAYDVQKGALWGADEEFVAASRLDNLSSCHAALQALVATEAPSATCVAAFFDHEEVGSESATGAGGTFAADVLNRIAINTGADGEDRLRAMSRSFFVSADMAHAYHPNFPGAYEPGHKVMVNRGPVIKTHSQQRYTTSAETAARFMGFCEKAEVPYQQYAHRGDIGCGSTIGPIVASQLGIASVDVGSAMWGMHSVRESAGAFDQAYMTRALAMAFAS